MQIGLGIRYDDTVHRKLKIIAAYKSKSLNRLMNDMFNREIADWEREHDKETEKIFNQVFSKRIPQEIQRIALNKLLLMDTAENLNELRIPPANHLEQLHGDREGQYSIRINRQFRICFTVSGNDFDNVEITDYH